VLSPELAWLSAHLRGAFRTFWGAFQHIFRRGADFGLSRGIEKCAEPRAGAAFSTFAGGFQNILGRPFSTFSGEGPIWNIKNVLKARADAAFSTFSVDFENLLKTLLPLCQ